MDIFSEKDETNDIRYGCNPLILALFGILKIQVKPYLGGPEQGTQKKPRDLTTYAILLRFDPEYLGDKEVLNFGCGDDRFFMKEMKEKGIQPKRLVRLDVNRELRNIAGEGITIYDGINLPKDLKNSRFDVILASFVIHQIEGDVIPGILEQLIDLLKANGTIHIGPVFKREYHAICELLKKRGDVEIVVVHPFQKNDGLSIRSSTTDIDKFLAENSPEKRIIEPERPFPYLITAPWGLNVLDYRGGSYVILRKKDSRSI